MVNSIIRHEGEGPVSGDRQLAVFGHHRLPVGVDRLGLGVAIRVGIDNLGHDNRVICAQRIVVHQIAGNARATFFGREDTVINRQRNIVHDRDVEGNRIGRAVAVRHSRGERNVDLVLAIRIRMIDLTLQREGVARATTRHFHGEDRRATGGPRDGRAVVGIGQRNAIRGHRWDIALTRQGQATRSVRAVIDGERTGCRQRLFIRVGTIAQVVLIHTAGIHAQLRMIRVFLAYRRLARRRRFRRIRRFRCRRNNRRSVIRNREGLGCGRRIAVIVLNCVADALRQRVATGVIFIRIGRVTVGPVGLNRQLTIDRVDRIAGIRGLRVTIFIRVSEGRQRYRIIGA